MPAIGFGLMLVMACGFYTHVLVQFHRERTSPGVYNRNLHEHLHQADRDPESSGANKIAGSRGSRIQYQDCGTGSENPLRRSNSRPVTVPEGMPEVLGQPEAVINLVPGVGGLAGLFAGILLFNSLVIWAQGH